MGSVSTLLTQLAVKHQMVEELEEIGPALGSSSADCAHLILLDAHNDEVPPFEAQRETLRRLAHIQASVADAAIVPIAPDPAPALVLATVRAGAVDFIDLATDTSSSVEAVLRRIADRVQSQRAEKRAMVGLRSVINDFFRELVQTERRSIDLEHQLRQKERATYVETIGDLDSERAPVVFIVDDDREVSDTLGDLLEETGFASFSFLSGEDALAEAEKMASRGDAIDVALVDAMLPGIDGLETIVRLRELRPRLATFLMTGFSSQDTAIRAADLGVSGYILKPFDDLSGLAYRIKEHAEVVKREAREQLYLARIKARHEKVLARYTKLAAILDAGNQ